MSGVQGTQVVVVVDGFSTGASYPGLLSERGAAAVHVSSGAEKRSARYALSQEGVLEKLGDQYITAFDFKGNLDALVTALRPFAPVAVVAGAENGVELSDAIAERLGVPGNGTAQSLARRNKYVMQQAIERAGLRAIRSLCTDSLQEMKAWAREINTWPLIVKPLRSAGTDGVQSCTSLKTLTAAFEAIIGAPSFFGETNTQVLIQEQVFGQEMAVNTVSWEGRHLLSDLWEYRKICPPGSPPIYDATHLVRTLEAGHREVVDYAMAVLDALGIQYGPAHVEVMLTATGPVLIECAARPMGGAFPRDFLQESLGETQAGLVVESILSPETFIARMDKPYEPRKSLLVKFLISTRQGDVDAIPGITLLSRLPSVYGGNFLESLSAGYVAKTVDLFTNSAMIFLSHDDEAVVDQDWRLIRDLETEAQNSLFELRPKDKRLSPDPDWFSQIADDHWLKPEEQAKTDAATIARLLDIKPGDEILDCPCGDARVCEHLAKTGARITGVDLNERFIAKAGERFRNAGMEADLQVGDMRHIGFENRFDIVLNWFNSFGYFGIEDDFDTLCRLARALRPGGRILMEAPNRTDILNNIHHKFDEDGTPLPIRWDDLTERMVMYGADRTGNEDRGVICGARMYSLNQYNLLFRLAGLDVIRVMDENLNAFTDKAKRMLMLACKP